MLLCKTHTKRLLLANLLQAESRQK